MTASTQGIVIVDTRVEECILEVRWWRERRRKGQCERSMEQENWVRQLAQVMASYPIHCDELNSPKQHAIAKLSVRGPLSL